MFINYEYDFQIDVIEDPSVTNVIILQTVLEEVNQTVDIFPGDNMVVS